MSPELPLILVNQMWKHVLFVLLFGAAEVSAQLALRIRCTKLRDDGHPCRSSRRRNKQVTNAEKIKVDENGLA
jgi:hypothetical protein